ncbi:hypothetical protein ACK3TF_004500 [Chlorella vulgaris]
MRPMGRSVGPRRLSRMAAWRLQPTPRSAVSGARQSPPAARTSLVLSNWPDGNSSDSNHQGSWAVAYVCTTGAAARMHGQFTPDIIPSSGCGLGSKQRVTLPPPPLTDQNDMICCSTFCLGGIEMECAEGTRCTGVVNGQSPCTWDYPEASCPGPWEDGECCNARAYCFGGVKVKCKPGQACTGPKGDGCQPIAAENEACAGGNCESRTDKPDCSSHDCKQPCDGKDCEAHVPDCSSHDCKQPCDGKDCEAHVPDCTDGCQDTPCTGDHPTTPCSTNDHTSGDVQAADTHPEPEPETCGKHDWKCMADEKSFCDVGHTYTCPGDTIRKGKPPCVRRVHCKEVPKTCDSSVHADWTCLDEREYCHAGEVLACPDGTKCTGSINGNSPCTSTQPSQQCPGHYDDWACINQQEFCVSGHVMTCGNGTFCTHLGGEGAPCTPHHSPATCPKGDLTCISDNAFCQGGVTYYLPSDVVCKGTAPPVYERDDTCDRADNSCLNTGKFCYGGEVHKCADGYSCARSWDGKNPCTKDPPPPLCGGDWDDYSCVDASHYCLGGHAYKCASSKPWCVGGGKEEDGRDPCQAWKPHTACSAPDQTCMNSTTFCSEGLHYNCPEEMTCKGLAPVPCVYSTGTCPPKPDSHPPECTGADYTCIDHRDYCYKGEILQCCEGSKCVTGKGCVEDKPPPVCPAGCVDYQCLDLQHFCLGGHAMSCGDGTSCTGKPGPGSPCRSDHTKVACPKGDWGCTSSRTYCIEGVEFDCPFGAMCMGKGPCVYPTTDESGRYGI